MRRTWVIPIVLTLISTTAFCAPLPEDVHPQALWDLGEKYLQKKQYIRAAEYFVRLSKEYPKHEKAEAAAAKAANLLKESGLQQEVAGQAAGSDRRGRGRRCSGRSPAGAAAPVAAGDARWAAGAADDIVTQILNQGVDEGGGVGLALPGQLVQDAGKEKSRGNR